MKTDIGSIGITGREALERLARKDGTTAGAVLKKEIAAHRRFSRRGALYRADIMGTPCDGFFIGEARYNALKRRTA